MTFKEAELEVSKLRYDNYRNYTDTQIKALNMAEEALCILSDVEDIICRYQKEDNDV